MNLKEILKKDDLILKCLASHNVDRINRLVCNTNQGALELEIRKGERDYHFVLGAVPLSKEISKELMDFLFPAPILETPKRLNNEEKVIITTVKPVKNAPILEIKDKKGTTLLKVEAPKKLGRPKGSKDGIKDME